MSQFRSFGSQKFNPSDLLISTASPSNQPYVNHNSQPNAQITIPTIYKVGIQSGSFVFFKKSIVRGKKTAM